MGLKKLWTDAVTSVCGYKDSKGKFHVTEQEALRETLRSNLVSKIYEKYYQPSRGCMGGYYNDYVSSVQPTYTDAVDYILSNFELTDLSFQEAPPCKCEN